MKGGELIVHHVHRGSAQHEPDTELNLEHCHTHIYLISLLFLVFSSDR